MRAYGYDNADTINTTEAYVLRKTADRIAAGELSFTSAARALNNDGITTLTGRQWVTSTLVRTLTNPRYAGLPYGKYQTTAPLIITKAVHRKLVNISAAMQKKVGKPRSGLYAYLLTGGTCTCTICDHQLYAVSRRINEKARYQCRKDRGGCGRVSVSVDLLDEYIAALTLKRLLRPALKQQLTDALAPDESTFANRRRLVTTRYNKAWDEYLANRLDERELRIARAAANRTRKAIDTEQRTITDLDGILDLTPSGLATWWTDANLRRRRALVTLLIERIHIAPATRPGNPTAIASERVTIDWR